MYKRQASFTVVWADHVEKNKEYEINIPGAGVYHLTRIVPDVDPTGFTKWGVQDSDDPNYVNWRIRVNPVSYTHLYWLRRSRFYLKNSVNMDS